MREKQKKTQISRKKESSFASKTLGVEHVFPEGQRMLFSNHITIQHTKEGEFTLSFFEVFQPVLLGSSYEVEKQAEALNSVPATCLARVVISAARMPKLIGALIANYENYEAAAGKSGDNSGDDDQGDKKHAS